MKALVPTWPSFQFRTLDEGLELQRQLPRLAATLLGTLGGFGLLLAMIGVYGLMAYLVKQRRHETGSIWCWAPPSAVCSPWSSGRG